MPLQELSITDLKNLLVNIPNDSIVVDVRSKGEFAAGHIKGVHNIPLSQFAENIEKLRKYETIYILCWSGGRSAVAAAQLQSTGYKRIYNVTEGLQGWLAAGYPIEQKENIALGQG